MELIKDFYIDNEENETLFNVEIKGYRTNTIIINDKGKEVNKRTIICTITNKNNNKFLNLVECWDGSPFQSVKHAFNEARWFINNRGKIYNWC